MSPDWRRSQIEDLKLAVLVADAGEFASADAVAAVFLKHGHQVASTSTEVKPEIFRDGPVGLQENRK